MASQFTDLEIDKYPFLGYAPNLIDYFLIIGYDPIFISKNIITQKNLNKDKKAKNKNEQPTDFSPNINPTVLSTIPSFQRHNNLMIENDVIIKLIFPNIPRIYVYDNKNKDKEGIIPYCTNFGIYGDSNTEQGKNSNSNNNVNKQIYNGFAHVFYEKFENNSYKYFVPKAFCIISQYPYFLLFNNICQDIIKLFKQRTVEIPIEILLFNLVNFTPSPISAGLRLSLFPNYSPSYYGSQKELEDEKEKLNKYYENESNEDPKEDPNPFQPYTIPQLACYPIIDCHLSQIFGIFNKPELIELAIFSFLEIDIIFFSENISILNLVMYLLSTFSYPCMDTTYLWHILSVPGNDVNTKSKNPFVGKPFTGMLGVNCTFNELMLKQLLSIYQMFFVVDIDNQEITFHHTEDEEEVIQTAEHVKRLKLYIEKICDDKRVKSKFLDKAIQKLASRLNQVILKEFAQVNKNKKIDFYGKEDINKVQNTSIQEAFYDFVLNILKEFYSFYSLSSKDQENNLNLASSHSEIDSFPNLSMPSRDSINKSESSIGEEDDDTDEKEIKCKEMDIKTEKENTNYLLHYKENINNFCEEEKIFFNLFHDSSKFIPFVRDFFVNHKVMELYKIPLIFSEEFIVIKKALKQDFSSHYFEMMSNFYISELRLLVLTMKKELLLKKLDNNNNMMYTPPEPMQQVTTTSNAEEDDTWKAKTLEEFFLVERGRQVINFNSFYSYYGTELKTIYYEEMQNKLHVKPKIANGKVHFTYSSIDLDNQIIIDYATFIFSQNEETICKIFPSQNIIKRNAIIKVRVRKITNSIEKVLVLFKTITTESLLIYSFIIVLCTCCDFFEENDINLFLQALPSDLLCIRKYLTMIISVIYRIAISKWEEMKQNNSTLKDVTKYLRCCSKIVNYLNKKQILPDQQLTQLLECLYLLKQNIKEKSNPPSNNNSQRYNSVSLETNSKTVQDELSEKSSTTISDKSQKIHKTYSYSIPMRSYYTEQNQYEFHILPQRCNVCGSKSQTTLEDIVQYSKNSEYDGSFSFCEINEKCTMQTEKQYHKFLFIVTEYNNAKQERIEIYSPMKIYNTCARIIAPFYRELNEELLDKKELKILIINLIFYFDYYNDFAKEHWYSRFLFKYLLQLIKSQ